MSIAEFNAATDGGPEQPGDGDVVYLCFGTGIYLETVTLNVTAVNDAPAANPDAGVAGENETNSFDVLVNDTDPYLNDSNTLFSLGPISVSSSNAAVNGINATAAFSIIGGQVQFNPGTLFDPLNSGETATAVVEYTTRDAAGATATSTPIPTSSTERRATIATSTARQATT